MARIRKFLQLPFVEKVLLIEATALLGAIRLGLIVLPFSTLRRILGAVTPMSRDHRRRDDRDDVVARDRIVGVVETVGRSLPAIGTCLTQALAAHVLLRRSGHPSNLRIGVTRNAGGSFAAHAWLEHEGIILIGGDWHKDYTPMPPLDGIELNAPEES
jgi:hypothetical protein